MLLVKKFSLLLLLAAASVMMALSFQQVEEWYQN
jgi:hypothetical protein